MGYTGELPEHKKYDKSGKLIEPEGVLIDDLIRMAKNLSKASCFKSKHLNEDEVSCKAFPDVIPNEILVADVSHDKPYPGDNNIQFEEKKDKKD